MPPHLNYFRYVLRHKWFVFLALLSVWCANPWAIGLLWQGIVHDLSKFRPSEWFPYVDYFYGGPHPEANHGDMRNWFGDVGTKAWVDARFDAAWNHHQKRNPHHWQYWVLREDDGETKPLEMPEHYLIEMLADWEGAGRAITGKANTPEWYAKNRDKIVLHPATRRIVDYRLAVFESVSVEDTRDADLNR